ncbi:MAG: S-layer protein [Candidatus Peregrinibacteria bacterium GW2011_GWE2_39_6]|nr:MAG: S-layer protein [Candidatus Peregrinibacteria bacterium GW2011_GWF2_39_17]KKR24054.1 MAG: S-layer protein [Candidatus Peregrinibacteria bacterium GW2011_GWE2_39_6]
MKKIYFLFIGIITWIIFTFPVFAGSVFPDVYDSHPVNTALSYLVDKGVIQGYPDGNFQPLWLINRAEFTKMIVEGVLQQTPDETRYHYCFPDVADDWYAKYVCYAKELGWVQGYTDGNFHPSDSITRSEALKILAMAMDWTLSLKTSSFLDIDPNDSEQWFASYVMMAEERQIIDIFDRYASPHELISRAQMAEILYRAMKNAEGQPFEIWELTSKRPHSYSDILATGIQPAYPSDMTFTHHAQTGYPYGCYAFATKNLTEWKYGIVLDIAEVQTTINWDGSYIWTDDEFDAFCAAYNTDIVFTYNASAEFFFKKLAMGEPMILYIPYYLDTNGDGVEENIGHNVVAYSFDQNGVWIADSISPGSQRQLDYDEVFPNTDFYTQNLTQIRQVKDKGLRKDQSGL